MPPPKVKSGDPDIISVWVREEIGTVGLGGGDDHPAVAAFRLIQEQIERGRPGTYGFAVYGTEYVVTAEPS